MLNSKELEIIKLSSKYKFALPPELTSEELFLKAKYEVLKKAKKQLIHCKTTVIGQSSIKKNVITKATTVKKESDISSKKTTDFKQWSKQEQDICVRRAIPIHSFEEDSKPRSVKVRGEGLTEEYLHKHFDKFGCLLKIRTNEDKTGSVLTFKQPASAVKSVETLNGSFIDGVKLEVSIFRKNNSWQNAKSNSYLTNMKNNGRSVHLSYKGYLTASDFDYFFRDAGRITRIYLNEAKHFGFAMFENEEQANRAIREMNGEIYKGNKVFVSTQTRLDDGASLKSQLPPVSENQEREIISYEDLEV